jgi:hypothetical protein
MSFTGNRKLAADCHPPLWLCGFVKPGFGLAPVSETCSYPGPIVGEPGPLPMGCEFFYHV